MQQPDTMHIETHPDTQAMFTFHQIGQCRSSLERQIHESLMIDYYKCDNILNGKGEWGANLVLMTRLSDNDDYLGHPTRLNRNRHQTPGSQSQSQSQSHQIVSQMHQNASKSIFETQLSQRRKKRRLRSVIKYSAL